MHYWASPIEARLCEGQEIALVGAGNSAGQAAVYLVGQVEKVWLIVRGASLAASMSKYLIERIEAAPVPSSAWRLPSAKALRSSPPFMNFWRKRTDRYLRGIARPRTTPK